MVSHSDIAKPERPKVWPKRLAYSVLALFGLIVLLVFALRLFITLPAGHTFIENQINARPLGPVESVQISGLSGDPLSQFSVNEVKVFDKNGLWLTLEGFSLDWHPLSLLRSHADIDALKINKISALRKPELNPMAPREEPLDMKVTAKTVALPEIQLAEAVLGTALSLKANGGFLSERSGAIEATLRAARTDISGPNAQESIDLNFNRTKSGEMRGTFDIFASENGPLAALLRAPDNKNVTGSGTISGDFGQGDGTLILNFGADEAVTAKTEWNVNVLTLNADVPAKDWAVLAPLAGLNAAPSLALKIDRQERAAPFTLSVLAGNLSLTSHGTLPADRKADGLMPKTAELSLNLKDPGSFVTLPEGYAMQAVSAEGRIERRGQTQFNGRYQVSALTTPYANSKTVSGPLDIRLTNSGPIQFQTQTTLDGLLVKKEFPLALGQKAVVNATGSYNRTDKSLQLQTGKLSSAGQSLSVQGRAGLDPLHYSLSGNAALMTQAIGQVPPGQLRSDFKLVKTKTSFPSVTADGVFTPKTAFAEPLGGLIGEKLLFDIAMQPNAESVTLTKGSVRADGFRAEASGQMGDRLNIDLEAQLMREVNFRDVKLSDQTQLSANLSGTVDAPSLKVDASTALIAYKSNSFETARLRAEVQDIRNAPKGPVRLTATTEYGDLDASATFSSRPNVTVVDDITATLGTLSANGRIEIPEDKIVTGRLALDLPEDGDRFAKAEVLLERAGTEQGLSVKAEAKNVAYKTYELDSFSLNGSGTLAAFTGKLSTKGQGGAGIIKTPFRLDTPIQLQRDAENTITAQFSPDADYGRIPLRAATPLTVSFAGGVPKIQGEFDIRDGNLNLEYAGGDAERMKLTVTNIPVRILPLPTALAETRGRVALAADIGFTAGQVDGDIKAEISDWRGFERDKSEAIGLALVSQLSDQRFSWTLNGESPLLFDLKGTGDFPLTHSGKIASIRPDMDRPITGQLNAQGAAAALFGLVTPADADLEGSLSAELDLSGTLGSPQVQGEVGGSALRLEVPQTGTQIRNGQFTARFTNDSLTVSNASAQDAKRGTLSGAGDFKLGEFGRPIGTLNVNVTSFQALDRRDLSTRLSGDITVAVEQKSTEIGGDIRISELELSQFVSGAAGVVEIEVTEINAPERAEATEIKAPALPVNLNINMVAPRRIFVRSKGLDVELSLNTQIRGTVSDPQIFGEATVLRGGYTIAGKELEFESGSVQFDGPIASGRLDFKAVTETQNLEAVVQITGTVEKPEIILSSNPERPQDEILSAILFGRSATELSTLEAAQLAGALAQFSGNGSFDLLGGFRDALGIGQLSIGVGEDGGALITGGRYLAKNVYLQVYSGVGANNSGAVIDWEVRKNISLRSRLQSDNDQSLSLKWKRDF